ncbi:MAG: 4-hydroxy-tetrahydrodipicolinate reductase [Planctomycetota bacterium]
MQTNHRPAAPRAVLLVGADGRMGRQVIRALERAADLELVGTVVRGESLAAKVAETKPQIAVDFALAEGLADRVDLLLRNGVHPVVGTTGLAANDRDRLVGLARELRVGGVLASNFSIGAVLMVELAGRLARHFDAAEVVETHHPGKKDAPSGTALITRDRIAAAWAEVGLAATAKHPVPVHSVRLDGFLARQEVHFGAPGERVTVAHEAIDRECYMPGVLLACRRVHALEELVIGLDSLLS